MKINSLILQDFRNHKDTAMAFDRLNIITGRNNSGKSSLVYAIETALTGRCAATDKGGRGADDLINLGAKKARVELDLEGLGNVIRGLSSKGSSLQVGNWTGAVRAQQEMLYEHLEADADLITNLLNVSSFVTLPAKEQQAMLLSLVDVVMDGAALAELLGESLYEVLIGMTGCVPVDTITPDDVDIIYKEVFTARAEAKKNLAGAEGRLSGVCEFAPPADLPSPDELPEIREQLTAAESRRETLLKQIANGKFSVRRVQEIAIKRTQLEKKLEELGDTPYEPNELEGLVGQLTAATEDADKAKAKSSDLAGQIRGMDESVKAIKKAGSKCPVSDAVKCPLSKDDKKALLDKLGIERTKLVRSHEKAINETTAASMAASELTAKVDEIKAGAEASRRYDEVRAELDELTTEAKELVVTDTIALETEEAELAQRISKGHALIAAVEAAQAAQERAKSASMDVDALRVQLDAYERLVAMFGPGPEGIKSKMLETVITDLSLRVSVSLQDMTGGAYRVGLMTDPDFHILIDNGSTCVEPKHLSTSERFRVGIAFAVELARLSRLGLLVIDDAEILDRDNRALLSGYLDGLDDFETIVLIATQDEEPAPADMEGISRFWVENGNVKSLAGVTV